MSNKESGSNFYVKSGNTDFAHRQKSIFGQLDIVEKEQSVEQQMCRSSFRLNPIKSDSLKDEQSRDEMSTNTFRKPKVIMKRSWLEMKQFQGQESIFKETDDPPFQPKAKNRIPDHHRNPHKWTKYSLDDVSKEDMSNRSNTAAAFSFLREIAARKEAIEGGSQDTQSCEKKIAFKRPKQKDEEDRPSTEPPVEKSKPSFKSSKVIMPEYVVGQSQKKERTKPTAQKSELVKEITLNHLIDEEEEESE